MTRKRDTLYNIKFLIPAITSKYAMYYGGHKILAVTFLTFKKSVNKPLGIVTLLSILVILTINLNCLKLRYSKNPT
jgi:hypothetical protein